MVVGNGLLSFQVWKMDGQGLAQLQLHHRLLADWTHSVTPCRDQWQLQTRAELILPLPWQHLRVHILEYEETSKNWEMQMPRSRNQFFTDETQLLRKLWIRTQSVGNQIRSSQRNPILLSSQVLSVLQHRGHVPYRLHLRLQPCQR